MTAKRLKVLAAYNDAEIMGALIQMKDDDQAKMSGYLVEIMRRLNKVDTTKVERPKTKKKTSNRHKTGTITYRFA